MTICTTNPDGSGAAPVSLQEYIEHKIGSPLRAIDADSHERFLVIEAEALRDLVVMAEVSGIGANTVPCPHTLDNPDCGRIIRDHCRIIR